MTRIVDQDISQICCTNYVLYNLLKKDNSNAHININILIVCPIN